MVYRRFNRNRNHSSRYNPQGKSKEQLEEDIAKFTDKIKNLQQQGKNLSLKAITKKQAEVQATISRLEEQKNTLLEERDKNQLGFFERLFGNKKKQQEYARLDAEAQKVEAHKEDLSQQITELEQEKAIARHYENLQSCIKRAQKELETMEAQCGPQVDKATAVEHKLPGKNAALAPVKVLAQDWVIKWKQGACYDAHELEDVNAVFPVCNGEGKVAEVSVSAAYCATCGLFHLSAKAYAVLAKQGLPLAAVEESEVYCGDKKAAANRSGLKQETVLRRYGYEVQQVNKLTEEQSHALLEYVVDKKILRKDEVLNYLQKCSNMMKQAKPTPAQEAWEADKAYLAAYKLGSGKRGVQAAKNKPKKKKHQPEKNQAATEAVAQ